MPFQARMNMDLRFNMTLARKLDSKRQQLNQRFRGLSLTLALLQANVTRSNGLLGKTKMREKPGTRRPVTMHVNTGDSKSSDVSFTANPQIEFHTGKALSHWMWCAVYHRWMGLYVVEHLFRANLSRCSLALVNEDHDIQPNRTKLDKAWLDATLFVPFANSFLNSITETEKVWIVVEAFSQLDVNTQKRYTSRNKDIKMQIEVELNRQKSGKVARSTQHAKSSVAASIKPTSPPVTPQDKSILPVAGRTIVSNGLQSLV
ncbi:hypothetical protein G9A89_000421 [Geosiphon pyriformis]|nr:hypothetical protein G9A89_000421 [Geosiphon pyriformis]